MKHLILAVVSFFLMASTPATAQLTKKEIKTYQKSVKKYKQKKYEKAIELLDRVLENHRYDSRLWGTRISYCYQDYKDNQLDDMFEGMTVQIETKGGDENSEENANLKAMLESFMSISPKKRELKFCIREATRYCNDENMLDGNIILRTMFIDKRFSVDTGLSVTAHEVFYEAQQEFMNKNFNRAAELYQEALKEDTNFYKARLYTGDCYYAMKEYQRAAPIFRRTAEKFPNLLEPQKYYIDALMGMDEWEKGVDACIEGILRYPAGDMFNRMANCVSHTGKSFDQKWMPRACTVNRAEPLSVFALTSKDTSYPAYWKYYQEAVEQVKQFSDANGILEPNSVTDYLTLEAYSWDYMLENADNDIEELETAREMKEKGMLEPYVLISLYHFDLFDQFRHYSTNKRTEAEAYIRSLIE